MVKKIFVLIIILQIFSLPLYAEDYNFLRKLGRGLVNLSLGWIEIPKQMIETKNDRGGVSGDVAGFFLGSLKGIAYFLGRTAVGGYEIVTSAIPPYKPVIEPEFIFAEYEEE